MTMFVALRRSGVQIKEIRDISGSHIKILPPDELPPCALSNDRVVQCVVFRRLHFPHSCQSRARCFLSGWSGCSTSLSTRVPMVPTDC